MKIAVMQSNYIPWKGYFDMINMVDTFVIYDTVQYTKNDWRNRNMIATKNGVEWLTIPVRVESLQQTINQTKVAKHNWNKKHWNTLLANYSRAAHFADYKEQFESTYLSLTSPMLSEINLRLIKEICALLGIDTNIVRAEEFDLQGDKNQRLIQLCSELGANTYLSGPAAQGYMNRELFDANGIAVEWMQYQGYKPYRQLAPEFSHAVTILDLLFNEGANARNYLNSTA